MASQPFEEALINESGEIALDGKQIYLNEITSKIRKNLSEYPNLVVSVKASKNADYAVYIEVLDRLKTAWGDRATRISIADPE